MRILVVDDEPEKLDASCALLRTALDAEVLLVESVAEAVAHVQSRDVDLVIADIFLPLGHGPRAALGPRARRYAENLQHLGGLVLLDELDRVDPAPRIIAHTACTDFALLQVLGDRVGLRLPKPAPADAFLQAVIEVLTARQ
jgi:CheY-like chemotaxis protein